MKKNETDVETYDAHPSKDTTLRCPTDAKLREKGFHIHERKKNNEAVWIRGGKLFKQSEALKKIKEGKESNAKI